MIETKNISFSYGKSCVLQQVNFKAEAGETISLIGPNGSGKSTFLRCVAGIYKVSQGDIYIDGIALDKLKTRQIAQKIAFLPQSQEPIKGLTVSELVALGRSTYQKVGWKQSAEDKQKIAWAIDYMQLKGLKNRYVNALSGGEKQRAWIAMILAKNTPIILLDEPVTYMDMNYQCQLLDIIADLKQSFNKTVITVFHNINHALKIADKVYLFENGKVFCSGRSDAVITRSHIKAVYNVNAQICKVDAYDKRIVVPISVNSERGV